VSRASAAALAVALLLVGCSGADQKAAIGKPAPGFQAAAIVDGQRVDLSTFRGRPTLVNFWGSWCDPCRRELPRLVEAEAAGVAVVGVAVRDSRRLAREMLAEAGASWPSADDPDLRIARRWGVGGGFPVTFAVDPGGVVRGLHIGEMSSDDLASLSAVAGLPR
jgi:thiol-disulfide isomerase/thioredoxin